MEDPTDPGAPTEADKKVLLDLLDELRNDLDEMKKKIKEILDEI